MLVHDPVLFIKGKRNGKHGTFVYHTFHLNIPMQKVDQFFTESQPKPHTTLLVILALYTVKLLKYIIQLFFRYTDTLVRKTHKNPFTLL